jgi:hypothetical protein
VYSLLPPAILSGSLDIYPEPLLCTVFVEATVAFQPTLSCLSERASFLQQILQTVCISHRLVCASPPSQPILRGSRVTAPTTANVVVVTHYSGLHNRSKIRQSLPRMSDLSLFRDHAKEKKNEQAQSLASRALRFTLDCHTRPFGTGGLSIENCYR